MDIRKAENADCQALFELHVDSIKSLCSDHYSKNFIAEWIGSKSIEDYKNISNFEVFIVGEEQMKIVGFGLLDIKRKYIKALFISPKYTGKKYGKYLLKKMEEIAKAHSIDELFLFSTLNAVGFYHHMGYRGNAQNIHTLSSGLKLECVNMTKKLI